MSPYRMKEDALTNFHIQHSSSQAVSFFANQKSVTKKIVAVISHKLRLKVSQ
jgi:hypothetical protein